MMVAVDFPARERPGIAPTAGDTGDAPKLALPCLAAASTSEEAETYRVIVVILNSRWRVIECRNGIQWILQHSAGLRHGTTRWEGKCYYRTRAGLAARVRELVGPEAAHALASFPAEDWRMSGALALPRRAAMSIGRDFIAAEEIAMGLGGRKSGANWQCRCPAHDDKTPSLSLRDSDDGKVLLHCFGGCDPLDIIAELQRRDLWPKRNERRKWPPPPIRPKPHKPQEPDNAARAREIWHEATDPRGTPVETYLASRGLALPEGVANRVIRYHPRCPFHTERLPCLIARFSPIRDDLEPEASPTSIHRIRLDRFAGDDRKLSLGPSGGQCIKLSNDEDVSIGLHLAEGIETGIALMMQGWMPIWVCATGTIQTFPVLDGIECLTVFADHDAPGFAAAQSCCDRWADAKREVFIRWSCKIGSDFADEVRP